MNLNMYTCACKYINIGHLQILFEPVVLLLDERQAISDVVFIVVIDFCGYGHDMCRTEIVAAIQSALVLSDYTVAA